MPISDFLILEKTAEAEKISRSELIRKAIKQYYQATTTTNTTTTTTPATATKQP
jgi:metal-responsive CopG/Arc/MetJ family transcriptional regulator